MLRSREHVVVDMEAGIEHLGRGTAEGVDLMLVVVEPGWASLETAARVASLARDLGIRRIEAVANKISGEADLEFVRANLTGPADLGTLPARPGSGTGGARGMRLPRAAVLPGDAAHGRGAGRARSSTRTETRE